jgi:hypothetical protein
MFEAPSLEMWADLRAKRPSYDDALEMMPVAEGIAGARYGIDHRGDLHLLLSVDGPPTGAKPPDLRGLRVRYRQLEGYGDCLDLVAAACHQNVFSPLCAEVLNSVFVDERKPWETVFSTIRAWQSAWKTSAPAMDKAVQIGLYGELLALELIMIPAIGPRAVHHWSGPERERHDFVGAGMHLEVKTSRKRRHEHEISRVDQLNVPAGRQLFLASLLLEESSMGTVTLAERIDAIVELVRGDPEASDAFQTKLVQIGWSDEMRRTGELLRFHAEVDSTILPVDEQFPRLPDDFTLPSGVVSLRYTVDLANLPGLGMDEVIATVKQGFHDIPLV